MNNERESIEKLLMVENSRRNTDLVADLVVQKPSLFGELIKIYLSNEEPVSRRAVWVADTVAEAFPDLLEPFIESMILKLPDFKHDGLKRNTLRMLSRHEIPEQQLGGLIKICFDWLISSSESVAVKVYAMDILYRISNFEPSLKKELSDSIEWRIQEGTPGFKAHGTKVLKKLYKEMYASF